MVNRTYMKEQCETAPLMTADIVFIIMNVLAIISLNPCNAEVNLFVITIVTTVFFQFKFKFINVLVNPFRFNLNTHVMGLRPL